MNARVARWLTVFAVISLGAALLPSAVGAFPVSDNMAQYQACGRVFPDPHAYWPSSAPPPEQSPWAKGNGSCRATDFLGWDETLAGLNFLASDELFSDFVEVYNLGADDGLEFTVEGEFADVLAAAGVDGMTAGLPTEGMDREKVPLYLIRVTDEEDATIPITQRQHFAYALSIHGIERAGVEGGIRAIEDLATWGSCEKHGEEGDTPSPANCARENAGPDNPHPIMETIPEESTTAGDALKQQSVWFMLNNPDGWRRGDKQDGGFFYQRYNGNGVDMNRDWPTIGYTFRPYTPFSEPETQAIGEAMKSIKDKWTGGIDLHGQLAARAFSFTLIGASERPYDKDRRVLQFTKGAWADAEERLAWHPLIVPNDRSRPTPAHMYGVQWGTIWDTINYTVTGALGDWMDSPLGLDADGIDNEMSFSHLSNCGIGTCFITDFEQLHVDGNKSLIYAQMHYSLMDEDTTFDYKGRAAYLHNPQRVTHEGSDQSTAPAFTKLPPQEGEEFTISHRGGTSTREFEVKGPDDGVYNGGIRATITWNNARAVSAGSLNEIAIDRYRPAEEDPDRGEETEDEWQVQNSYYNQSFIYLQSGAQLDVNLPLPGRYRVRISGVDPSMFDVKLEYLEEQAWPDPGQLPYDVSNMDFFDMLSKHVPNADKLVRVSAKDVLAGKVDLGAFDTVVAADEALLPGFRNPRPATPAQETVTGTVAVPGPGAGVRNRATSAFFEFDVEERQGALDATVKSTAVVDPDLYLQVQKPDGSWSEDLATGETGRTGLETLSYSGPKPGHYRLEVHNWAGSPGPASVEIVFTGAEEVKNESPFTVADRDKMAKTIKSFARGGGNLVLTDNSLRAVEWMGLTPKDSLEQRKVYAGHVQFSDDGGDTATYDDPLAANVNQPGAAEGSGHRHQIAEPVPTGYAIQDESGGDLDTHPQWAVERTAYDEAKGRVVGTVGEGVTLGEIGVGDGVVRILGNVLPQPTEEFDHPFGLASYGVTYSGYEVMRNLLDWTRPINRGCIEGEVPASGFTDTAGNTHETNIECIAWYGITVGTSKTKYSPARPITREQMASFIARLAVEGGLELPAKPADAFRDDGRSVHEDNINALAKMGLVKGVGGKRYDPTGRVTRAQMATFIANVHKAVTGSLPDGSRNQFPDDNGSVHESNINALAQLGVVRGRNGKYFPAEFVSRAQMASFVMHDLGLMIVAEKAYFGGADVTLESPNAADGAVKGTVKTNKELRSLVADGCGLENKSIEVAENGSFTVEFGEDQSGQCQLTLTATTRRPATTGTAQKVSYDFTVTIS